MNHRAREWLWEQPRERFDRCLTILSVLGETKVFLFWSWDWVKEKESG